MALTRAGIRDAARALGEGVACGACGRRARRSSGSTSTATGRSARTSTTPTSGSGTISGMEPCAGGWSRWRTSYDAVCVGAHPDDVEIGMGGTVAKMTGAGLRSRSWTSPTASPRLTAPSSSERPSRRRPRGCSARQRRTLTREPLSLRHGRGADRTRDGAPGAPTTPAVRPVSGRRPPGSRRCRAIALAARFYASSPRPTWPDEPFYPSGSFATWPSTCASSPSRRSSSTSPPAPGQDGGARRYESQFADNAANTGSSPLMEQSARMWGSAGRVEAGEPFFALEPALSSPDEIL